MGSAAGNFERELLKHVRTALEAYRVTADVRNQVINAAARSGWRLDPSTSCLLHATGKAEMEALGTYVRIVHKFRSLYRNQA